MGSRILAVDTGALVGLTVAFDSEFGQFAIALEATLTTSRESDTDCAWYTRADSLGTYLLDILFGGAMACKKCASEKQQYFSGELTVAFLSIEKLKQAPVYVVQKILVCLDCGYAEIIVPTDELQQLRKGLSDSA